MSRKVIADAKVFHVWEGMKDVDGVETVYTTEVTPDWYEENGTPVDEYGEDMVYLRTEIEV